MEDRKTTTRRARPAAAKSPTADKPKASTAAKRTKAGTAPPVADRRAWIATAAYFRAERRGFTPGREVEDWLEAEAEMTARAAPPKATPPARKSTPRARKTSG